MGGMNMTAWMIGMGINVYTFVIVILNLVQDKK